MRRFDSYPETAPVALGHFSGLISSGFRTAAHLPFPSPEPPGPLRAALRNGRVTEHGFAFYLLAFPSGWAGKNVCVTRVCPICPRQLCEKYNDWHGCCFKGCAGNNADETSSELAVEVAVKFESMTGLIGGYQASLLNARAV
jgi:hypothetical protein